MPVFSATVIDAVSKAVTPSAFEMDKFEPKQADSVRITLINTDGSQMLQVYLETRPKVGIGTWCRHSSTSLTDISPGDGRDETISIAGAGEVRVMGTASGAGLTATYGRKNLFNGMPR